MRCVQTILLALCLPASAAMAQPSASAMRQLAQMMEDPATVEPTLVALRSTRDKDLLPLFVALSRSGDRNMRLFATASLVEIAGPDAAGPLLERLKRIP